MTVEHIDNLAAAFHYFVWPNAPVDYGYHHPGFASLDMNEVIGAIKYAQTIGLDDVQVDIFYCKVAEFTVPNHVDKTTCMWRNKHDRIASEYVPTKPRHKYHSDTFQDIRLDSVGRDIP